MSARWRGWLLLLPLGALLPALWRVILRLPAFGECTAASGLAINRLGPPLRHVSNMVTAVNFDFRALDTLGEEFMLLAAVTGSVTLLRGGRGEGMTDRAGKIPGRARMPASDSQVLVCRLLGPIMLVFGIYMAIHATSTPGGGFQGGVVIASAVLLVYLSEGYGPWRELVRSRLLDVAEGGGALLFALAALLPIALGGVAIENLLPLGTYKSLLSGGLIGVENLGVTFAVAGGFTMLLLEFMEETREPEGDD